jgi:hypothetical protein
MLQIKVFVARQYMVKIRFMKSFSLFLMNWCYEGIINRTQPNGPVHTLFLLTIEPWNSWPKFRTILALRTKKLLDKILFTIRAVLLRRVIGRISRWGSSRSRPDFSLKRIGVSADRSCLGSDRIVGRNQVFGSAGHQDVAGCLRRVAAVVVVLG